MISRKAEVRMNSQHPYRLARIARMDFDLFVVFVRFNSRPTFVADEQLGTAKALNVPIWDRTRFS